MLDFLKPKKDPSSQSLYQVICGALQKDGTLPADFSLPRPNSGAEETQTLRFADGAFDGISLYHMAPDKRDIKSLTEILGLIGAGAYDKAAECLQLFFSMDEYISMLPLIDDLQSWIIDHKEQISAQAVYEFSAALLKESPHIESIKFALSCLELMDLSGSESTHVRNLIRVLALSDEFTLHCLFVMGRWPDANEAIFETAKRVFGWGRIHAVERLEPEREEIRRWILLEGWHNRVAEEYSALTCLEKSGAIEKAKAGALDDGSFAALCELMLPLLNEGPVAGIGGLGDDAFDFLEDFLALCQTREKTEAVLRAAAAVSDYCKEQEVPRLDLISRANAILGGQT